MKWLVLYGEPTDSQHLEQGHLRFNTGVPVTFDRENFPSKDSPHLSHQVDEETWVGVPSTFDRKASTLTAVVDMFSDPEPGGEPISRLAATQVPCAETRAQ
ncbi:MAG: hypothetical protein P1S60_05490 [Anaerolineae bacterium]|nr:hypothetical protein [Anaerolineae bacterium]